MPYDPPAPTLRGERTFRTEYEADSAHVAHFEETGDRKGLVAFLRMLSNQLDSARHILRHGSDLAQVNARHESDYLQAVIEEGEAVLRRLADPTFVAAAAQGRAEIAKMEEAKDAAGLAAFCDRHANDGQAARERMPRSTAERVDALTRRSPRFMLACAEVDYHEQMIREASAARYQIVEAWDKQAEADKAPYKTGWRDAIEKAIEAVRYYADDPNPDPLALPRIIEDLERLRSQPA